MKLAFVFPGQGSQSIGMGLDLHTNFQTAKDVFAEIDDALGQNLSKLMFCGDEDELTLTQNAQPAIMAVSLAVVRILQHDFGIDMSRATYGAGHSLGEYSAHAAAGTFSLSDTARLLRIRGNAMQAAVPVGIGAMAALIGPKADMALASEAAMVGSSLGVCVVANDNNIGQVVISGHKCAIDLAMETAKGLGAKASLLNVSAPFHCPLMEPAALIMREALMKIELHDAKYKIIANVTAQPIEHKGEVIDLLVQQVTSRVRWRESVQFLAQIAQMTHFAELGAGKVLTGMIRRLAPDAHATSLNSGADFEAFATLMAHK